MTGLKLALRILAHAVFLLAVYILQALIFPLVPMAGLTPLLLPIAVAGTALFEGVVPGGVFGLFAGLLCDAAFGEPTMLFTLYLTAAGVIIGYMGETVLSRGFPSYMAASFAALLIAGMIQSFEPLFFQGQEPVMLMLTVLLQSLYSILFALLFYFVSRALARGARAA